MLAWGAVPTRWTRAGRNRVGTAPMQATEI